MMVEKGMQARRELSSWSSNRRQSTVGIAPVFRKLKTCPQWYNSSNNSTPSNPSQAVLQTEQQVFKHESMGAILFETTHLCIAAYIRVPGPDSKSFQVQFPAQFFWLTQKPKTHISVTIEMSYRGLSVFHEEFVFVSLSPVSVTIIMSLRSYACRPGNILCVVLCGFGIRCWLQSLNVSLMDLGSF